MLTFAAFHIFSKALLRLMEGEEIPFRTYSAVAFQAGGFTSLLPLIRVLPLIRAMKTPHKRGVGQTEWGPKIASRRSDTACAATVAMALLTLYIAALPTLFSAMTGYSSVSYPSLSYFSTLQSMALLEGEARTRIACDTEVDHQVEGMTPAWGVVLDAGRVHNALDF
jgi:hypothetical protein